MSPIEQNEELELLLQVERLIKERDEARREIKLLYDDLARVCAANAQICIERDEVRRWFCRVGGRSERAARTRATKRDWNCFDKKEGKT